MSDEKKVTANAVMIKRYFNYEDAKTFAIDWKQLTDADKAELVAGLQAEIDAGRWTP